MSHIVDHSNLDLTMQEDNSSLELLLVRLAREGTQRPQDNQGCLDDTVIPLVGLHSLRDAQTRTSAHTLVHLKATEAETTSTRLHPEYSLLIPRMKEKGEIVESKCEEANLGNYLRHA